MKVKWTEIFSPNSPDDFEDWVPVATEFCGEVVGTVRSWGETKLVVMLDSGKMREVPIGRVEKDGE